jgi:hypothetical protein
MITVARESNKALRKRQDKDLELSEYFRGTGEWQPMNLSLWTL